MKQYSDTELLALAEENQQKARRLVAATRIVELWREAGAEVNLVGSLRTGLLMTHRDVDFHVYTPHPSPLDGIGVMARLAGSGRLAKFRYGDLMDTEERCLEFHAWLRSDDGELWQFDMIHIEKGSHFDGHFERVADRIGELLTPETRLAVLRLKFETPETVSIPGIEYCRDVLDGGVRDYGSFEEYRRRNTGSLLEWMPGK